MTSTKERQQRAAARAKLAREMADRQESAKRRRQRNTIIAAGAAALVVMVGAGLTINALAGDDDEPTTPPVSAESPAAGEEAAAPGDCEWLPEDAAANPNLQDVGTPEFGDPPTGSATMTIATNHGDIEVDVDAENAPCTYTSFAHLAGHEFYDDTTCHRMTTEGLYVLQCGDPSATGMGGPTYRFAEENLPAAEPPTYPAGTMAMAKSQAPASTGSQFFLVYADTQLPPEYTIVGQITDGLDIVESVADDGAVDESGAPVGDGAPATDVIIETLRVGAPS